MEKRITILIIIFSVFISMANANNIPDNFLAPPTNDECASATELTINPDYACASSESGTVVDATPSQSTSSCGVDDITKGDVWYKFNVTTAAPYRISLNNVTSGANMVHIVYSTSSDCSALTPIVCSDPDTSNNNYAVGTYYVRVFSKNIATANFDICIGSEPSIPDNNSCGTAETIAAGASINMDASLASGGIISAGCDAMNDGVWYKIIGDGNQINIAAFPTGWDLEIGVYTGTCGGLSCVVNANDGVSGTAEGLSFVSTLGTEYLINIGNANDTSNGPEGVFTMTVSSTLSMEDLIAKGFRYYPNPVENRLQVQANEEIRHLAVYNAFGQELRLFSPSKLKTSIDLSGLATGAYFVRAYVGDKVGIFKVIKK